MLEMFAPGQVTPASVAVVADGPPSARRACPCPPWRRSVSYVDGVTGGNVFVMTLDGRAASWPPR